MSGYYHSVTLDRTKCIGCTSCLKRCPTEAIRVRGGRAHIIDELCIDCGECIRVCAVHAKVATTNPLSAINRYPYKIALPAPTLYGQFKSLTSAAMLARAFRMIGFDDVYDVARGADLVTMAVREKLEDPNCPRPLISSSCPAVVRLIQARFPTLAPYIVTVKSPMEVAAVQARQQFCQARGIPPEEVGVFFITPCAAKVTAVRKPIGHEYSAVSGAISIMEVYGLLSETLKKIQNWADDAHFPASAFGLTWARVGGEVRALDQEDAIAVDGIDNVIRVLEEIENGCLTELRFFEGLACVGGCVGGPLAFENPFIARNRIKKLTATLPRQRADELVSEAQMAKAREILALDEPIVPVDTASRDQDIKAALSKMARAEEIRRRLPGIDCGSCGSPTCRTLAEDVVGGYAEETDCPVMMKERLREMAQQMVLLSDSTASTQPHP